MSERTKSAVVAVEVNFIPEEGEQEWGLVYILALQKLWITLRQKGDFTKEELMGMLETLELDIP